MSEDTMLTPKREAEYSDETKTWINRLRVSALARFSSRELIAELRRRGKRIVIPLKVPINR